MACDIIGPYEPSGVRGMSDARTLPTVTGGPCEVPTTNVCQVIHCNLTKRTVCGSSNRIVEDVSAGKLTMSSKRRLEIRGKMCRR